MSNTEPFAPSHTRKVSYLMTRLVHASESACWYGHQCTIDDTRYCLQQASPDRNAHTHCSKGWHGASWSKPTGCARANPLSSAIHPTSQLNYQIQMPHFSSPLWQSREAKPPFTEFETTALFPCSKKCCPNEC